MERILARRMDFVKRNQDKEKKELAAVEAMKKSKQPDKSKENGQSNQQKVPEN